MTDFFKNNPTALRNCLQYEYLRDNPVEQSFTALRMTVGPGVIKKEEFQVLFDKFNQGVFDIDDSKERVTDVREVLRSDKYALRACILYESLKYKLADGGSPTRRLWPNSNILINKIDRDPSFFLYNHFCQVIGDDVMGYREFDFWFYRFLNGNFDLNYEREEDGEFYKLTDMPIDIMENVVEYLDIFDRMKLARTSRSLQAFVEDQKLFHHTLKLELNYSRAEISFGEWINIEYTKNNTGCVKSFKKRSGTRVEGVYFWKEALRDIKKIIKNPKLHLDTLEIMLNSIYCTNNIFFDDLETALKFNHYLNVKKLRIEFNSPEALLRILPSMKPGYLTTISVDIILMKVDMFDKIREMEQWKQATRFSMTRAEYNCPLSHLYHFNEFNVSLRRLSLEEIRQMKEILFKSPNFQKCLFIVPVFLDLSKIEQEFGNALCEDPNIYHYPIPNSTEYFEITAAAWTLNIQRKKC